MVLLACRFGFCGSEGKILPSKFPSDIERWVEHLNSKMLNVFMFSRSGNDFTQKSVTLSVKFRERYFK